VVGGRAPPGMSAYDPLPTLANLRMLQLMTLEEEERRATEMLRGKTVTVVRRHRAAEVMIEFSDETRLFVDAASPVELSITGSFEDES
jgi:hypothetical protein